MDNLVDIALVKARAGGYAALAKSLGLQRATVWGWRVVPAKHVARVSHITGIPREELRPDIFGHLDGKAAGEAA